ncbi:hypothetical protein [Dactylosporangium sp. NPDC048998]|uniref:hypothetical protein n=1 Tax=Dactylosporangium sp. NPDC048998 TaxID=3363976 RepID=UPI003719E78C
MVTTETAARSAAESQIDQCLLDEARRHLGGVGPNEAVNEGLRLLVMQQRLERREVLRELRKMSAERVFDYTAFDEVDE